MRGVINRQLHKIKSLYLRALLFNNDSRVYFYATLREYVNSHFPLLDVFNNIQQQSDNPALQEIARISKRAIRDNRPFATHYYQSGLFTQYERELLQLGERYDCMDAVTELLLNQDSKAPAALQILGPSMQWIFMSLVITAMSIYTLPYLQNYTSGYELFFDYVTFVKHRWPELTVSAISALLLYRWCSYRLIGPARDAMTAMGFFRVHNMLTEQRFLKLSRPLIATRLPPDEYLQLMENIFRNNRLFKLGLQKCRTGLKETSLLQVLGEVLSRHTYTHVLSCTPNQTPDEIANGFSMAERMLEIRLTRTIRACRGFCVVLFLTMSIAITIPFAMASMGMGIDI